MITLATLPQATSQEVFDQVATHLLRQRVPSRNGSGSICQYRDNAGLKCAAGCLISDEEYDSSMEGLSWVDLNLDAYSPGIPEDVDTLVAELQRLHDCAPANESEVYGEWLTKLRELATQRNLEPTKLMYRVLGDGDEVLETYWTQKEAESRVAVLEDTYLQCPGDF